LLRDDPACLKAGIRWGNLIVRASEQASDAVVESLIRAGADVNVRDDPKTAVDCTSGYTPLHAAAFHGNVSAIRMHLKHGASVTARDEKYHGTPAGWANHAGHTDARDLILEGPVDLMEAVENGLTERIRSILAEAADLVNCPFSGYPLYPLYAEGWYTPLVFAVVLGRVESVRVLLEQGADAALRTPDGRRLDELAQEKGNKQVAELLKQSSSE
jgi:ankyrin repeat protein